MRLVFDTRPGPAINASMVDMGNRFRLVVNKLDVIPPEQPLPKLPVARALWVPQPNLQTAAAAWILAGGAHHTSFAQAVTAEHMEDYAEMADIELLVIGDDTELSRVQEGTAVERSLLLSAARYEIVGNRTGGNSHHSTTY